MIVFHKRKGIFTICRRINLYRCFLEESTYHLQVHDDIVNYKQPGFFGLKLFICRIKRNIILMAFFKVAYDIVALDGLRDMDFEHGARTIDTLHHHTAIHHFDQFFGKVQSKAGTFNIPVAFQIYSLKTLEQFIAIVRANTNTSIGHNNHKLNTLCGIFLGQSLEIYQQVHRSLRRILDCIGKQIIHNLAESHFVAFQHRRRFRIHVDIEFQALALCTRISHAIAIIEHRKQVVFFDKKFHLARFNLGNIQDIVHQRQKRVPRILNVLGIFKQSRILAFLQEHRIHSQNAIDRRADFVAHVGKEKALGHIRRLCILTGFFGFGPSLAQFVGMLSFFAGVVQIFKQTVCELCNGNAQKRHGNRFNQKAR